MIPISFGDLRFSIGDFDGSAFGRDNFAVVVFGLLSRGVAHRVLRLPVPQVAAHVVQRQLGTPAESRKRQSVKGRGESVTELIHYVGRR